ncbi:MAG: WecB/TagA/CpsF family glycosyltransferase [Elainellaceae cyanobacterium]
MDYSILCGIRVSSVSFAESVSKICDHIEYSAVPEYVVTPNAHHIWLLQNDDHFREVYDKSFLAVPDGVPLLWASKLLGTPLKGRVNGTDLFETLCKVSAEQGFKVFLLGGRPGAAEAAADILQKRYSGLQVVGTYCPPYGFESNKEELNLINSKLQQAKPQLLFVGLGAPKQEKWIYDNCQELEVPMSIGIGVSFELISGMVKRAPLIMQKLGLEWLFRLIMEPRRLWKRYLAGNLIFVWLVMKQYFLGSTKNSVEGDLAKR